MRGSSYTDPKLIALPDGLIDPFLKTVAFFNGEKSIAKDNFVCTSAYGDGGPWYIPVKEEYPHGGYEVSVAFCEPEIDDVLTEGMKRILA
ncbi:MAG: hypothetical protein ACKV2Q_05315 [Planctomycetaceae bacterium]